MFQNIDFFGKPVALNFNGKAKAKSFIGATFTVIFILFVLWSAYDAGYDIIHRKNPKTIMSESFSENPAPVIISPDTFAFAFGLQHPTSYAHYINESIYTVEVTRNQLVRKIKEDGTVEQVWNNTRLEVEICTTEHFGELGPNFANIELPQLLCLKKDQPKIDEIRIQGVFESPIFEYINANIRQCRETPTSTVKCGTKEEIKELLGGGYFAVYFTNIAIDPKNYTYPTIPYRDSFYTTISNTYFKELTLNLNHVEIQSDVGWLLEDNEIARYPQFDYTREMVDFRPDPEVMMLFAVRVGKITSNYVRSYTKIPSIFADVNGFATAGLIVILVFLTPYNNMKFYERLINELFDVKDLKEDQKKGKSNRRKYSDESDSSRSSQKKQKVDVPPRRQFSNTEKEPLKKVSRTSSPIAHMDQNKRAKDSRQLISSPPQQLLQKKIFVKESLDFPKDPTIPIQILDKVHENPIRLTTIESPLRIASTESPKRVTTIEMGVNAISNISPATDLNLINSAKTAGHISPGLSISSPMINSSRSQLLQEKPQKSKPQIKVLENYDIQGEDELNQVLGSLLLDKEEKNPRIESKDIQLYVKSNEDKDEKSIEDILDDDNEESEKESNPKLIVKEPAKRAPSDDLSKKAHELPVKLVQNSDIINFTFWEYIGSFFYKSKELQEKMGLLQEGVRRIDERLDIFNVLKKFREVDKLKLLLLENEQLVLFDTLPKPELALNTKELDKFRTLHPTQTQLKEAKFISDERKHDLIAVSYENLKIKNRKTLIDNRLLEIYDDIIDS